VNTSWLWSWWMDTDGWIRGYRLEEIIVSLKRKMYISLLRRQLQTAWSVELEHLSTPHPPSHSRQRRRLSRRMRRTILLLAATVGTSLAFTGTSMPVMGLRAGSSGVVCSMTSNVPTSRRAFLIAAGEATRVWGGVLIFASLSMCTHQTFFGLKSAPVSLSMPTYTRACVPCPVV
jgi:hypothetical protein